VGGLEAGDAAWSSPAQEEIHGPADPDRQRLCRPAATGHGMLATSMGNRSGRAMADFITGRAPTVAASGCRMECLP